jgi:hypothetical protein
MWVKDRSKNWPLHLHAINDSAGKFYSDKRTRENIPPIRSIADERDLAFLSGSSATNPLLACLDI